MFYLVSYDIPETRRRTKPAKILEDFGDRVQYSVFECILDEKLLGKMIKRIQEIIIAEDDSIRIYSICAGCEKRIEVMGKGKVSKIENIYVI